MASPYAFVTLVSSDSYLPGALAQAAALSDLHPRPRSPDFHAVCLVTPESVDVSTIKLLRKTFDIVIGVEILEQADNSRLKLLGRPDLTTVLTKLHAFRLTQYSKIIFLDADVLPIRPISHLFELPHEFAAAPDVGWPDIFNSGVLVLTPGVDKFAEIDQLVKSKGSWDGGDQGILNEWRGDNWHRLSFTYNTTPTAAYTYAPAYERYGSQISVIHFIGPNKPWKSIPYRAPFTTHTASKSDSVHQAYDYDSLVDRWFAVYDTHYRSHPIISPPSFEVQRYTSAWDDNASRATRNFPTNNTTLSLDELKKLAIEGMNAVGEGVRPGEGEYRSMPLEGRVDLMRPKKEVPKEEAVEEDGQEPAIEEGNLPVDDISDFEYDSLVTPVSRPISLPDGSVYWHTLPTPGPNEIPSSPRPAIISLPPTPNPQDQFYEESSAGDTDDVDGGYFYRTPHHHGQRDHEKHPPHRISPRHSLRDSPPYHSNSKASSSSTHSLDSKDERQSPGHHQHQHHSHSAHLPHKHGPEQRPHHAHQKQHQHTTGDQQKSGHSYNSEGGDGARTPQPETQRPSSPPMLLWDPAKEPPPTTQPSASSFPTDTYFQNVWDQSTHNTVHDNSAHRDRYKAPESSVFFEPPPPSEIPSLLLREGHYRNVTGQDGAGLPPAPDPSKVKSIFPWEEKLRQLPARVFPINDAPKSSQFASPVPKPPPDVSPSTPPPKPTSPIRLLSPLGLSNTLRSTYSNAWDTVPGIQKYASKLAHPPPAPAPMFPAFDEEWRKNRRKSRDEMDEVSSRDGDDEDNADDEDEEQPASNHKDNDDDSDAEAARYRSRRNSTASNYSSKYKKQKYRSRGVQTVQIETRHQSIQVSTDPPLKKDHRRGLSASSGRRQWEGNLNTFSSATMQTAHVGHDISVSAAAPSPMSEVPQGHSLRTRATKVTSPSVSPTTSISLRSPREFIVPPVARVSQTSIRGSGSQQSSNPPVKSPPTTRVTSPTVNITVSQPRQVSSRPPTLVTRQISNGSSQPSPASSAGPISPPDGLPISPPARRSGRVWDPARGVEVFKRSSEEVLARFLKMGSWEDNNR